MLRSGDSREARRRDSLYAPLITLDYLTHTGVLKRAGGIGVDERGMEGVEKKE